MVLPKEIGCSPRIPQTPGCVMAPFPVGKGEGEMRMQRRKVTSVTALALLPSRLRARDIFGTRHEVDREADEQEGEHRRVEREDAERDE